MDPIERALALDVEYAHNLADKLWAAWINIISHDCIKEYPSQENKIIYESNLLGFAMFAFKNIMFLHAASKVPGSDMSHLTVDDLLDEFKISLDAVYQQYKDFEGFIKGKNDDRK